MYARRYPGNCSGVVHLALAWEGRKSTLCSHILIWQAECHITKICIREEMGTIGRVQSILMDLGTIHVLRTTRFSFDQSNLRLNTTRVSAVSHHVVPEQSLSKVTTHIEINFRSNFMIAFHLRGELHL